MSNSNRVLSDIGVGLSNSVVSHSSSASDKVHDDHTSEATEEPEKPRSVPSDVLELSKRSSKNSISVKEQSRKAFSPSNTSHASQVQAGTDVSDSDRHLLLLITIDFLSKDSTMTLDNLKTRWNTDSALQPIAKYLSSVLLIDRHFSAFALARKIKISR